MEESEMEKKYKEWEDSCNERIVSIHDARDAFYHGVLAGEGNMILKVELAIEGLKAIIKHNNNFFVGDFGKPTIVAMAEIYLKRIGEI